MHAHGHAGLERFFFFQFLLGESMRDWSWGGVRTGQPNSRYPIAKVHYLTRVIDRDN